MALPGSSDPQVQWVESTKRGNNALLEQLREAKAKEKGTLNFAAYRKAHDHQYLGIMGPSYLGRGYGNDSSNMDAILHGKDTGSASTIDPALKITFRRARRRRPKR